MRNGMIELVYLSLYPKFQNQKLKYQIYTMRKETATAPTYRTSLQIESYFVSIISHLTSIKDLIRIFKIYENLAKAAVF